MYSMGRTTLRKVIAAVLHHTPHADINDAAEIATLIVAEVPGLRFGQVHEVEHYVTEMIIEKKRGLIVEHQAAWRHARQG